MHIFKGLHFNFFPGWTTKRYYAKALLGCLNRGIAVSEWAKLRDCGDVPLERALGAFDLFLPESGYGDLNEVSYLQNCVTSSI